MQPGLVIHQKRVQAAICDCVVDASTHLLILFLNGPTIRSSHENKWQGSNLGRRVTAKYSIIELYIIETNIEGSKGCNLSFAR